MSNVTEQELDADHYEEVLRHLGLVVHIAIIHRKFSNEMALPMRYERYFTVWEARPPFSMLGMSSRPILFGGEVAQPWSRATNFADEDNSEPRLDDDLLKDVYFSYTPSLSWTFRARADGASRRRRGHEDLGTGYLDDEMIVGIGFDDLRQGYVTVPAEEALQCMRVCSDEV